MNAVINPEILFIEQERWDQEEESANYLQRILDLFRYISNSKNIGIYWDDDFECLVWENDSNKPWIQEQDSKKKLIQPIYTLLQKNKIEIEDSLIYDPCEVESAEIPCVETMKMMHYCLDRNELVYYLTKNTIETNVCFYCEHDNRMLPIVVSNDNDFIIKHEIINEFWPTRDTDAADNLYYLIKLFNKKYYGDRDFINTFSFKNSFVKSLIDYKEYGEKIISQIVKRLHMSLSEAQSDFSIHDEYIKQRKERRIRVTAVPTQTRIHYIFSHNSIEFLKFYGPGEHDKGL